MDPWILTYRDKQVWPLDITPDMIDVEDIIHALARVNRYTGHTTHPYSVAQHSVYVSYILKQWGYNREMQLQGLFHDASEAYIADVAGPLKQHFFIGMVTDDNEYVYVPYSDVEDNIHAVVCEALNIPLGLPKPVKEADSAMLKIECEHLMPHAKWTAGYDTKGATIDNFLPMMAHNAESLFRARYYELIGYKPEEAWKQFGTHTGRM